MLTIDSNNYNILLCGYMIAWNPFSIKGWINSSKALNFKIVQFEFYPFLHFFTPPHFSFLIFYIVFFFKSQASLIIYSNSHVEKIG